MDAGSATTAVHINDVQLACLVDAQAGAEAPLALCLHGFPDTAATWRHLIPRLSAAGYRVVAPYMRGYAPSAVAPDGRYQSGVLAADANALHAAFDGDARAVLIGHDWGAPAAYAAAVVEPERWRRVVGMAVPPGPAMAAALVGDLEQLKRSWYMFFFQHPLAEMVVAAQDLSFIDMIWADWSPGYAADHDVAAVKAALAEPAHLAAALGYYRSTLGDGVRDPALDTLQAATQMLPPQPTLYVHGRRDGCIGIGVAEAARAMCADTDSIEFEFVDGAGHFAHLEQPDDVNRIIIEFLERP